MYRLDLSNKEVDQNGPRARDFPKGGLYYYVCQLDHRVRAQCPRTVVTANGFQVGVKVLCTQGTNWHERLVRTSKFPCIDYSWVV